MNDPETPDNSDEYGKIPSDETRRRTTVRLPLKLWTEGRVDGRLDFHNCSNLSVGGIFIETVEPYDVGKQIQIEFNLPGVYDSIKVTGEVVSHLEEDESGTRHCGNGFRFLDLGEADHQLISKFIETSIEEESIY